MPASISDARVVSVSLGKSPSAVVEYVVKDTPDWEEAYDLTVAAAPGLFMFAGGSLGIPRVNIKIEEEAGDVWKAIVEYGSIEPPQSTEAPPPGPSSEFSFDTTGATQRITQAISTLFSGQPPGLPPAPDVLNAIGVTDDGVEGVDVPDQKYDWEEMFYFPRSAVTQAYRLTIANLTGLVNASAFRGFAAGEVLFRGAKGGTRTQGDVAITFAFSRSKNRSPGFSFAGVTIPVEKKGWNYIWAMYEKRDDTAAKKLVNKTRAVYLNKVIEEGDFSLLQIGT